MKFVPFTNFDTLTPPKGMVVFVNGGPQVSSPIVISENTTLGIFRDRAGKDEFDIRIENGARVEIIHFATGEEITTRFSLTLADKKSSVTLGELIVGSGRVTNEVVIHHLAPETTSVHTARCLATENGKIDWRGRVEITRDAIKSRATQNNKNLILADGGVVNARPEMAIETDDVDAHHGSATGALDAAALLYLSARGIPESEAKRLLVGAFAAEIFALVRDAQLSEFLRNVFFEKIAV